MKMAENPRKTDNWLSSLYVILSIVLSGIWDVIRQGEYLNEKGWIADSGLRITCCAENPGQMVMLFYPSAQRRVIISPKGLLPKFTHWTVDDKDVSRAIKR